MTPNGVRYIPDERIAEYVAADGLQVNKSSIAAARESLEGKLRGYYLDRVLIAMSEPSARTRAMMKQGTQPGTPLGEAIRFGGQFKSFTGSFMQNTIGREIYGRGYTPAELGQSRFTSLANAMRNGNGEKLGLAQLFIWMTALGYVSMQTKLLLKGQTPRPADAKTFLAAAAQGAVSALWATSCLVNTIGLVVAWHRAWRVLPLVTLIRSVTCSCELETVMQKRLTC